MPKLKKCDILGDFQTLCTVVCNCILHDHEVSYIMNGPPISNLLLLVDFWLSKMKQLVFVLSFCTFTYGFLLPGYLTLKDPLPDYSEDLRIGSPMEDLTTMKILIRKFHNLFQINKVQPMPFSWQDIPKFNTGVFTPRAWLKRLNIR